MALDQISNQFQDDWHIFHACRTNLEFLWRLHLVQIVHDVRTDATSAAHISAYESTKDVIHRFPPSRFSLSWNQESTKGMSEIEGKAARVAARKRGVATELQRRNLNSETKKWQGATAGRAGSRLVHRRFLQKESKKSRLYLALRPKLGIAR